MNSFEEFHAIKKRARLTKQLVKDENEQHVGDGSGSESENESITNPLKSQSNNNNNPVYCLPADDDNNGKTKKVTAGKLSSSQRGKLMELYEVQLLVCIFIFMDILMSSLSLVLVVQNEEDSLFSGSARLSILRVFRKLCVYGVGF